MSDDVFVLVTGPADDVSLPAIVGPFETVELAGTWASERIDPGRYKVVKAYPSIAKMDWMRNRGEVKAKFTNLRDRLRDVLAALYELESKTCGGEKE